MIICNSKTLLKQRMFCGSITALQKEVNELVSNTEKHRCHFTYGISSDWWPKVATDENGLSFIVSQSQTKFLESYKRYPY